MHNIPKYTIFISVWFIGILHISLTVGVLQISMIWRLKYLKMNKKPKKGGRSKFFFTTKEHRCTQFKKRKFIEYGCVPPNHREIRDGPG